MKNLPAHIQLLACNLMWACSYPLYNYLMPTYIKPLPLLTLVMVIAAIASIISMLLDPDKESLKIHRGDIIAIIVAALLITTLRKGLLVFGMSLTSPIDGSIISTITPVIVLVISIILGLESFSRGRALGVVLGLGGAIGVILTGGDSGHEHSSILGNVMILGCAIISAIYVLWFKQLLQRYRPIVVLQWMFCITAAILLPMGLDDLLHINTSTWSSQVWLAVAYLAFVPTYIPNLLLTTALKQVPPTITSIYTYVQPVVAVTISIVAGLDKLHPLTLLFAILIFTGVGVTISTKT